MKTCVLLLEKEKDMTTFIALICILSLINNVLRTPRLFSKRTWEKRQERFNQDPCEKMEIAGVAKENLLLTAKKWAIIVTFALGTMYAICYVNIAIRYMGNLLIGILSLVQIVLLAISFGKVVLMPAEDMDKNQNYSFRENQIRTAPFVILDYIYFSLVLLKLSGVL